MDYSSILMIVVMIAIFYFMLIRPENKRKKQAEEMRSSIKKGERITTIGGMVGKVVQVNDSTIVFETSEDRVRIEIAKWGVQSTESMEAAQAQQKSGGLFGGKKSEDKPAESKTETPEPAKKDEKADFDPEIK
ncbi:MAG: preprotein translocase subunit YajC [Oscillospiraceae bacterium]|nr:preprotein translocase subunit YajC [Oscillospiraceae bacterium]